MLRKLISTVNFCSPKNLNKQVIALIIRKITDEECNDYVKSMVKQVIKLNKVKDSSETSGVGFFGDDAKGVMQFNRMEHEKLINLLITIGGDGTVLHAMKQFQNRVSPPVLTFGKGTLGFMCAQSMQDYVQQLEKVIFMIERNLKLTYDKRSRLYGVLYQALPGQVNMYRNYYFHALNEFYISRGKNLRIPKIELYVNDNLFMELLGDGLIVSTPNGSTAYSLSAGGPIVQGDVKSVIISPICPVSLSYRPTVLPSDIKMKVKLASSAMDDATIIGDGQVVYPLSRNDFFLIQQSNHDVNLIRTDSNAPTNEWVNKLQRMLNWNTAYTSQQ